MEITSKCCDAPIRIGQFTSWCENCGNSVNPDDGEPYQPSAMFKVGDKVQLSYCDDTTVYEIDKTKWSDGRHIYHLLDVTGWKDGINLAYVP